MSTTVEKISSNKVKISFDVESAKFDEAMSAARDGVNHATHLFNAMSALAHRNPGVVGAAHAVSQRRQSAIHIPIRFTVRSSYETFFRCRDIAWDILTQ